MKRYTERERERLVMESESWNGSVADFCRQRGGEMGTDCRASRVRCTQAGALHWA